MQHPKILATAAAGRTGSAAVLQLLEKGFPVRAFVRRRSPRAVQLERAGAELFIGDLFDFRDLRQALKGVQRAYYCPPFAPNLLHGAMLFAIAAEEAHLEVVALMSQWNPHATHPSYISREHWITNHLYRWMPSVDVIHINPGIFAFVYLLGLPMITHFGLLMAPFGDGRNAPPSNEDIARVVLESSRSIQPPTLARAIDPLAQSCSQPMTWRIFSARFSIARSGIKISRSTCLPRLLKRWGSQTLRPLRCGTTRMIFGTAPLRWVHRLIMLSG